MKYKNQKQMIEKNSKIRYSETFAVYLFWIGL